MASDIVMIRRGIVGIEGKPKSAFASYGTVATTAVAASFGEDGEDVVAEADGGGRLEEWGEEEEWKEEG